MDGWKTYLCASAAVVVLGLRAAGQTGVIPQLAVIPDAVYDYALWLLGFGGLAALRSAVSKAASVPLEPSPAQPELPHDSQPPQNWQ